MDAAAERVRAQLTEWPTTAAVPLTSDELRDIYLRGNDRRPLPPNYSGAYKVNLVQAEDQWRRFCELFHDPQGRQWKTLLRALCWEEKGIADAFGRWFMRRPGGRVTTESTARRYLRNVSALYKKYQGSDLDERVREHMYQTAKQELTRKFGLRTEPKHKNILGPRGFTYLVHFAWVRSQKPFKIGLDRLDYVFCRMVRMWTGCRSHELVWPKRNTEKRVQRYDEESDAYTDLDDGTDRYMEKIPKRCWVCNQVDDRTLPQYKVLCWEDITVRILPDPENNGGRDVFAMDVLLRFHKGHNNETVPTVYHFIEEPYLLLCPIVHIIGKACAEGVVDWAALGMDASKLDISCIVGKLFQTKIREPSVVIPWKKEYLHTPVFRRTDFASDGRPVKLNEPITKYILDNNAEREGKAAGLPDKPQTYDDRRGNLESLDTNYRTSVRNRGARHRPGTNTYETSYVGQGMRAITQDAFLGRGTHSPLIDILNHIGLCYDENAPSQVTDEMMRLVGPNSTIFQLEEKLSALRTELGEKYGRASQATGADKTKYTELQSLLKVARQRHGRKVLDLFRKDHFTTKNNDELGRQLSGETRPDAPPDIQPVYFTVPERRQLAAIFGNFDDEISGDSIVRKKIDVTIALIRYAWIVETKDQALLADPTETKHVDNGGPRKRPWFASMIRDPAVFPAQHPGPVGNEGYGAPNLSSPRPPAKSCFTCMFCGKAVRRKATMWNCVDRHIAKVTAGTGVVACPRPECKTEDAFRTEMDFKCHAAQSHRIWLRAPKEKEVTLTGLPALHSDVYCSLRTSPTLSVPYVENLADMFCLDRWEHNISTSEANELITSPYPELPDTMGSAGHREEDRWDLSTQVALPISHSGGNPELGSVVSTTEGCGLWEQPWTASEGNPEGLEVYEQLDEAGWDNVGSLLPPHEMDSDDAGSSTASAALSVHLQAVSTFMGLRPETHDADPLDPALREQDTSISTPSDAQDIEMEDCASIPGAAVCYPAERVLEKRGRMLYLLWQDGSRSWQDRDDVGDGLIAEFEAKWKGYHLGVDVLYRKPSGRAPFRLQFKDWPWENATIWATSAELSPEIRALWPSKPRRQGRKSLR